MSHMEHYVLQQQLVSRINPLMNSTTMLQPGPPNLVWKVQEDLLIVTIPYATTVIQAWE